MASQQTTLSTAMLLGAVLAGGCTPSDISETVDSDSGTEAASPQGGDGSATDGGSGTPASTSADGGSQQGNASVACSATADFRTTVTSPSTVSLAWAGAPGVKATLLRKTYCGGDAYSVLANLAPGSNAYSDMSVQANWAYWYELQTTDASGIEAAVAIGAQASASDTIGCVTGAPTSPGAPTSSCAGSAQDAGTSDAGSNPVPTTDGGSGFTPIPAVSTGAQIVHPGDDITSSVQACSKGIVHFSAGTYSLTSPIHVPANCQLEGDPDWASVITGGVNDGTIFQIDHSSNITITRLNFQNAQGNAISNFGGAGTGNVAGTHIYLNLFEGFTTDAPVSIFDPTSLTIERNAFNNNGRDGIHLFSSSTGFNASFVSSHVVVRWNFGAGNNRGANFNPGGFGDAFIEIQLGTTGLHVDQNVYYSEASYQGTALSIASGSPPCTQNLTTGCVAPDSGQSTVFIDGNIILDNGVGSAMGNGFGGIEIMGTEPVVQNNWQRGWAADGFTGVAFTYDAASNSYSEPKASPVYFQNNTACDLTGVTDASQLLTTELGGSGFTVTNIGTGGNKYDASCASMAPPALYPQIVVPPDMLDSNGGLNALQGTGKPGAGTYWPDANAHINYAYD